MTIISFFLHLDLKQFTGVCDKEVRRVSEIIIDSSFLEKFFKIFFLIFQFCDKELIGR